MKKRPRDRRAPAASGRDIETPLTRESLSDRGFLLSGSHYAPVRILPDANVLKIGGQSIMDRGRAAVYPILEEIVENKKRHNILLCAGGGTRARHAYEIAMDLELPTGILAAIGASTPVQNARMLTMLLARHGGIYITTDDFDKLPLYFRLGCLPIMTGMPPYTLWEKVPERGRIPPNRTDSGTYLTAEFLGARTAVFIKDEKGLYTADPKKDKHAQFISKISAEELLRMDLKDLIIERVVLTNMIHAHHVKEIQVVNGLVRGNITKALNGDHVGTVIFA